MAVAVKSIFFLNELRSVDDYVTNICFLLPFKVTCCVLSFAIYVYVLFLWSSVLTVMITL